MSYKALYRTYRPQTFEEMAGQKHVLKTLQNAIKENKIAHAYLFTGPRGTGKTSMAKLLAKALNCECENGPCNECENCKEIVEGSHPDVVEIDAASNNGVDEVRSLIDKVKYSPIMGKYKVYIIDEVHMMSTGAFNALLKTLEEPPAHVIFILATTEPHKVLPTIISRCQRFDFGRISAGDIKERIETVLDKENITYESEVVDLVCELCDGGMRDALSILDQAIAYAGSDLKCEHIREIYGVTSLGEKIELLNCVCDNDEESIINKINEYDDKGVDLTRLTIGLIDLLKEMIIYRNSNNKKVLKVIDENSVNSFKEKNVNRLFKWIDILVDALSNYKKVNAPKSFFELACLKMASSSGAVQENVVYVTKEIAVEKPSVKSYNVTEEKIESLRPSARQIIVEDPKKDQMEEHVSRENVVGNNEKFIPTEEDLLNVLVQATKDALNMAKQKWVELPKYLNSPTTAKATVMLTDGLPVAAAKNMLVLAYDNETYLNRINSVENHDMMNNFLKAIYKENMMCYCVTKEDFMKLKDRYMELRNMGKLPSPRKISFGEEEAKKDEGLEFGKKIFGDFLQVKEE
jgi:DNA polymerase-3 subunit gamma/tau